MPLYPATPYFLATYGMRIFDSLLPEDRREVHPRGGGVFLKDLKSTVEENNRWFQTGINSCFYDVAAALDQKFCDA
jgi:hypothetical protein